ncbi:putative Dock-9 [Aphelenchoides besseyi]|nr:putative Dock-9 [Aphelenchoides besseyi]
MSTGESRAFVAKRQKTSAAEIRKQVAESSSIADVWDIESQSGSKSAKSVSLEQCLTNNENVNPVDVEEILSSRPVKRIEIKLANGELQRVNDYNEKDTTIQNVPREIPFYSIKDVNLEINKIEPHVYDLIHWYKRDYVTQQRNYVQFSTADALEKLACKRAQLALCCEKQIFETDPDADLHNQRSVSQIEETSDTKDTNSQEIFDSTKSSATAYADPVILSTISQNWSTLFDNDELIKDIRTNRKYLVSLFVDEQKIETSEFRSNVEIPRVLPSEFLRVRIQNLELEPKFEPVFASFAFYDLNTKRRISENFHFDFNSREILGLIRSHLGVDGHIYKIRTGLFNLENIEPNVFLVFRLEKILQASDISEAVDAYISKDKPKDKLTQNAREFCDRLGAYRMAIGWNFVDLQSLAKTVQTKPPEPKSADSISNVDITSLISADRMSTSTIETLQHSSDSAPTIVSHSDSSTDVESRSECLPATDDNANVWSILQPLRLTLRSMIKHESEKLAEEDILKMLADIQKSGVSKSKFKTFPVTLNLEIGVCKSDELDGFLSSEGLPIGNFVADANEKSQEIIEFPIKPRFSAHSVYRNLLYIYPRSVNFSAKSGNSRNITVRIELFNSAHIPLKVFFGKSSGPKRLDRVYTSVSYHNKTPNFLDEIKMEIPVEVNDDFYLLFTFCHISCKKKETDVIETPIGYTWHPLYTTTSLQTGEMNLPISLEQPPVGITYISPSNNVPNINWLQGHKNLFNVSFVAVSTVHPEDSRLTEFFRCYYSLTKTHKKQPVASEQEIQNAIRSLSKVEPTKLSAYLYVIFDKLIALITCPPYSDQLSATCFDALCQLVKLGTILLDGKMDKFGRSALLNCYIKYHSTISYDNFTTSTVNTNSSSVQIADSDSLLNLIKNYEKSTSTKLPPIGANYRLLHEELAAIFLKTTGLIREQACTYSSFFLELMVKAIAESLWATNRLPLPRKLRVSDQFLENLTEICEVLTNEAIDRAASDISRANGINAALAFFIHDLISLLDRTFLLNRIRRYNKLIVERICETTDPLQTTLMAMKLDFMQIVCSHEHFVILNVPFDFQSSTTQTFGGFKPSSSLTAISSASSNSTNSSNFSTANQAAPPSPSGSSMSSRSSCSAEMHLSQTYRSRHFLLGFVLCDLMAALNSTNVLIHSRAIRILSKLIVTHELDERLSEQNPSLRNRVASLYLPLITILMEVRGCLYDPIAQTDSTAQSAGKLSGPKNAVSMASIDRLPIEHHAIAGVAGQNPKYSGHLSKELTMEILSCFCWVLKNVDRSVLHNFILELSLQRVQQLVELFQLCISVFEYKQPFDVAVATQRPRLSNDNTTMKEELKSIRTRKLSGSSNIVAQPPTAVRWRQNVNSYPTHSRHSASAIVNFMNNNNMILERELSTEISLTVLNSMVTLVRIVLLPEVDHFLFILPNIIRVLMQLLSTNQSAKTLESTFLVQRSIVAKCPGLIFEQQSELCTELCLQLLRQLASRLRNIRSNAAASLYLLMRQSYVHSFNFSKVKTQITMALSTLSSGISLNEDNLRRSLKTVLTYLQHDLNSNQSLRETNFGVQVRDLIFNLHMILTDTVKMRTIPDDFEMLIDLMHRIAMGYKNNADLRLTWLINIANKHAARRNYAEAGHCFLHCAALVNEYLSMKHHEAVIDGGAFAFLSLSSNIEDESAISDDVVSPEEVSSSYFSSDGFLWLIDKVVDYFEKAQFYELIPEIYKIVEPILSSKQNLVRLAQTHARITENLQKIEPGVQFREDISDAFMSPLRGIDKRSFGTYFRVGFYGFRFGDLNGEEFIYKEPFFTKLPEISHRLEAFYVSKFGKNVVEVIKDSNDLDARQLDQSKAYLQITFVEPYFEIWEKRRRTTHLSRNYGINRFVYSTPFTRDGKAHGELKDQYKRRTILTTQHFYPFVKTRLRVIDREQKTLSPIEVAIEDLQKRTREMHAAVVMDPPDVKMLQMVLQGCIGTTVNVGCIAIARTFLSQLDVNEHGVPKDRLKNKLKLCFKDFSKKCSDALQRNETLISVEQLDYQKELRRNYADFTQQLAQILIGPVEMEEIAAKMSLRTDHRSLPVNLHAYTSHAMNLVAEGPISSV